MTINGYEFDRFLRHDESRRGYAGEHATKPAH
jgi:hypothetical protein